MSRDLVPLCSITAPSLKRQFLDRVERAPEGRCLALYGPAGLGEWRTAAGFFARAQALAARLRDQGLGRGEVCVLSLPHGEMSATATLATLLLGALPLLVAPPGLAGANRELPRILVSTLRKARARLVLLGGGMRELEPLLFRGAPATRPLFGVEDWPLDGAPGELAETIPAPTDLAALQLTSGTTGRPRICAWEQRAVLAALEGMARAMALRGDDVCFNWTPLYHDMGLVNNFFLALATGMPLVLLSPQDFIRHPELWLRGLAASGATQTWSPNFGFAVAARRIDPATLPEVRLDGVRAFWNAAERIHLRTCEDFYNRFQGLGLRREALKTNFGCAENIGGATFSAADGPLVHEWIDGGALAQEGIARQVPAATPRAVAVVSAGRAHPGLTLAVLSPRAEVLPDGRVGEVALRTPSAMRGYLGDHRASARAQRAGWLRTGDLAYLRGGELFWVGRVRERITLQGKKLDPSSFEAALLGVEGLREGCFAAFGVADEAAGTERIVIVSEVREPLAQSPAELAGAVKRQVFLSLGVGVSDVVLVGRGTLAKTSSGKRRHRHFREQYLAGSLEARRITAVEGTGHAADG